MIEIGIPSSQSKIPRPIHIFSSNKPSRAAWVDFASPLVYNLPSGILGMTDCVLHPTFSFFPLPFCFRLAVAGCSADAFFDRPCSFLQASGNAVFAHLPNSLS
jgi:hypothetical protein